MPIEALTNYAGDLSQPSLPEYQVIRHIVKWEVIDELRLSICWLQDKLHDLHQQMAIFSKFENFEVHWDSFFDHDQARRLVRVYFTNSPTCAHICFSVTKVEFESQIVQLFWKYMFYKSKNIWIDHPCSIQSIWALIWNLYWKMNADFIRMRVRCIPLKPASKFLEQSMPKRTGLNLDSLFIFLIYPSCQFRIIFMPDIDLKPALKGRCEIYWYAERGKCCGRTL